MWWDWNIFFTAKDLKPAKQLSELWQKYAVNVAIAATCKVHDTCMTSVHSNHSRAWSFIIWQTSSYHFSPWLPLIHLACPRHHKTSTAFGKLWLWTKMHPTSPQLLRSCQVSHRPNLPPVALHRSDKVCLVAKAGGFPAEFQSSPPKSVSMCYQDVPSTKGLRKVP